MGDNQGNVRQREEAKYRVLWDEYMDNKSPWIQYKKIVVMMISWIDTDMSQELLKGEISDLQEVLENQYNCKAIPRWLHSDGTPEKRLNKYIAEVIDEHDSEDSLLIIYYAGHGFSPVETKGDNIANRHFNLQATATITEKSRIAWHNTERILSAAEGDILGIFDCCEAGRLLEMRGQRRFEYLGACGRGGVTCSAGPESFTRALIWALKHFAAGDRLFFTTADLRTKILDAPGFPKDQTPIHGLRNSNLDLITLAPIRNSSGVDAETVEIDKALTRRPGGAMLNLQLQFDSPMTDTLLKETAKALKSMITHDELSVKRIVYLENYVVGRWWDTVRRVMSTGKFKVQTPEETEGGRSPMPEDTIVTTSPSGIRSPRPSLPDMVELSVKTLQSHKRKASEEPDSREPQSLEESNTAKRRRSREARIGGIPEIKTSSSPSS